MTTLDEDAIEAALDAAIEKGWFPQDDFGWSWEEALDCVRCVVLNYLQSVKSPE